MAELPPVWRLLLRLFYRPEDARRLLAAGRLAELITVPQIAATLLGVVVLCLAPGSARSSEIVMPEMLLELRPPADVIAAASNRVRGEAPEAVGGYIFDWTEDTVSTPAEEVEVPQ